jgi:hypothetical protein
MPPDGPECVPPPAARLFHQKACADNGDDAHVENFILIGTIARTSRSDCFALLAMADMTRAMRIPLIMLAIFAATGSAAAAPVQSYDGYKSWLVACDNTLSCVAKGFGEGEIRAELKIERDGGPNGNPIATLASEAVFAARDISLDGKPLGLDMATWTRSTEDADATILTTDDLPAIQALVARLRSAKMLTLGRAEVPLDGLSAALLRMDDRQGRIDGTTALIRRGAKPTDSVPAPPVIPAIRERRVTAILSAGETDTLIAKVRTEQRAVFAKEECEEEPGAMTAEAFALDARQALAFVPCIMGAYQGSSLAFIVPRDGKPSRQLTLPAPYLGATAEDGSVSWFTEAGFDADSGTVSTAAKGRGMADCGMSASWIWDGAAFNLSSMTLQQNCGGLYPGDWPTLFRSAQ